MDMGECFLLLFLHLVNFLRIFNSIIVFLIIFTLNSSEMLPKFLYTEIPIDHCFFIPSSKMPVVQCFSQPSSKIPIVQCFSQPSTEIPIIQCFSQSSSERLLCAADGDKHRDPEVSKVQKINFRMINPKGITRTHTTSHTTFHLLIAIIFHQLASPVWSTFCGYKCLFIHFICLTVRRILVMN